MASYISYILKIIYPYYRDFDYNIDYNIDYNNNVIKKKQPCIDASLNKINFVNSNSNSNSNNFNDFERFYGSEHFYSSNYFTFYKLYIFIDDDVPCDIKKMYEKKAHTNNMLVDSYLENYNDKNSSDFCYDSGFDLFCPQKYTINIGETFMLDHKIKCCMKVCSQNSDVEHYVGYYLYCRSSTGSKTPLRLANSVGIIDSGYRGNIKACFDCVYSQKFDSGFILEMGNRYTQICPPNLGYPTKVYIVDKIEDLGSNTIRQSGGFGSSGE